MNINELITITIEKAQNGDFLVAGLVLFFIILFNINNISDFLVRREERKWKYIKETIGLDSISDNVKKLLEEELNKIVFRKITGISASKNMRETILKLISLPDGELQDSHFTKARQHLHMHNNKLEVKLEIIDWFHHKFSWFSAIYVALWVFIAFAIPFTVHTMTATQLILNLLIGFALLGFFMFLVSQTVPYSVAKKIKPLLEKYQQDQANEPA